MALIKCPECGKEISNRAEACLFCGCPIGSSRDGILRVNFYSWMKLIGNMFITVHFEGQDVRLTRGYYHDFTVPADGKIHEGTISCWHGIFDSCEISFSVKSGESKQIDICFNDSNFGARKWEYRENFLVTK